MELGWEEVRWQAETSSRLCSTPETRASVTLCLIREGFLVREWHQTTSLCTGSAEINSRVWRGRCAHNQSSSHCVCSRQLKLFFKLTLIVWAAYPPVAYEGQGPIVPSLLIPQHYNQVRVIVAAIYVDLGALLHYLGGRLLECGSAHLACGEKGVLDGAVFEATDKVDRAVFILASWGFSIINKYSRSNSW